MNMFNQMRPVNVDSLAFYVGERYHKGIVVKVTATHLVVKCDSGRKRKIPIR